MKLHSDSKTLIVGAGGGGIASALLAALRGEDVTLLEAHYALGGCASFFKRGQFVKPGFQKFPARKFSSITVVNSIQIN